MCCNCVPVQPRRYYNYCNSCDEGLWFKPVQVIVVNQPVVVMKPINYRRSTIPLVRHNYYGSDSNYGLVRDRNIFGLIPEQRCNNGNSKLKVY